MKIWKKPVVISLNEMDISSAIRAAAGSVACIAGFFR